MPVSRAALILAALLLAPLATAERAARAQQVPNPMSRDGANAKLPEALINLGSGDLLASNPLCTTTSGSAAITACNGTQGITVGMILTGPGIPVGTKVQGGITATGFTMTAAATANATGTFVNLRPAFWSEIDGADPSMIRVPGRLMVGSAVGRSNTRLGTVNTNLDWCPTTATCPQWAPRDASLAVMSPIGGHAIVGMSKSSVGVDSGNPAGAVPIALAGVAINDTADATRPAWGAYLHATHANPTAGSKSWGLEIALKNKGSVSTSTPYLEAAGATGISIRGSDDETFGGASTSPSNTAIFIGKGASASQTYGFKKGIVFQSNSIEANDGTTGSGVAIDMARGHLIRWTPPDNTNGAYIVSEVTAQTHQQSIRFDDENTSFRGANSQRMLRVTDGAGGASSNNLRITSTAAAGQPSIVAEGVDTDIAMVLSGKGAGYVYVTAPIRTFGYTVATLPAGSVGMRAYVTDQTGACAQIGAAIAGGGALKCPVFHNGTAWVGG